MWGKKGVDGELQKHLCYIYDSLIISTSKLAKLWGFSAVSGKLKILKILVKLL